MLQSDKGDLDSFEHRALQHRCRKSEQEREGGGREGWMDEGKGGGGRGREREREREREMGWVGACEMALYRLRKRRVCGKYQYQNSCQEATDVDTVVVDIIFIYYVLHYSAKQSNSTGL